MPPKRVSSASKPLSKKQLEEQAAEIAAAQAARATAQQARLDAEAAAAAEQRARDAEMEPPAEDIPVPRASPADVRAAMMRSFGHLFPTPPPPPSQPQQSSPAAVVVAVSSESAASTPNSSRPSSSGPKRHQRKPSSGAGAAGAQSNKRASGSSALAGSGPTSPAGTPRKLSGASTSGEERPVRGKKPVREGSAKKKSSAAAAAAAAAAAEQAARDAEQAAAAEAAARADAAAAASGHTDPRYSPATESRLESLRTRASHVVGTAAAAEAALLSHRASMRQADAAESLRLVSEYRLIPQVDFPDEQRRLKEQPFVLPADQTAQQQQQQQQQQRGPIPALALAAVTASSNQSSDASHRTLPPRTDRQVLSRSGLIDLQAILDRQRARQLGVNDPIERGAPPPPRVGLAGSARERKHVRRISALDSGQGGAKQAEAAAALAAATGDEAAAALVASHRARLARNALVASLMPHSSVVANQALLAHMRTLRSFPRNPRFDERGAGPGGKGVTRLGTQVRGERAQMQQQKKRMHEEHKEQGSATDEGEGALDLTYGSSDPFASLEALLPQLPSGPDSRASLAMRAVLSALSQPEGSDGPGLGQGQGQGPAHQSCLQAFPPVAWFRSAYQAGQSLDTEIVVKNIGHLSRRIRVESPSVVDPVERGGDGGRHFSVGAPRYPTGCSTALLAPGMSARVPLRFTPSSRTDYASVLSIATETGRILVPLWAARARGRLDLPPRIDVGVAQRGGILRRTLTVRNVGTAPSRFWTLSRGKLAELEYQTRCDSSSSSPDHPSEEAPGEGYTTQSLASFLSSLSRSDEEEEGLSTLLLGGEGAGGSGSGGAGGWAPLSRGGSGGRFKLHPACWDLAPGEGVDVTIEYDPDYGRRENGGEAEAGGMGVESLEDSFCIVGDNTSLTLHTLSASVSPLRIVVEAVDGVDLTALHRGLRAAVEDKRTRAVATLREKKGRPGSRLADPLSPPPCPPRLRTHPQGPGHSQETGTGTGIGPGSPEEERVRESSLRQGLLLPHPLPSLAKHQSLTLPLHHLPGLLSPVSRGTNGDGDGDYVGHGHAEEAEALMSIRSFHSLVFPPAELQSRSSKSLTLRNDTPLPVAFHWNLCAEQQLDEEEDGEQDGGEQPLPFSVSPSSGSLPPHSSLTFTFSFAPGNGDNDAQPGSYRARAAFVVEAVPLLQAGSAASAAAGGGGGHEEGEDMEAHRDGDMHPDDDATGADLSSSLARTRIRGSVSDSLKGQGQVQGLDDHPRVVDLDYLSFTLQAEALGVSASISPSPLLVFEHPLDLGQQDDEDEPVWRDIVVRNESQSATARFEFLPPRLVHSVVKRGPSDALLLPMPSPSHDDEAGLEGSDDASSPLADLRVTPSTLSLGAGESAQVRLSFRPRALGSFVLGLDCVVQHLREECASDPRQPGLLRTRVCFETRGPRVSATCPAAPDADAEAEIGIRTTALSADGDEEDDVGLLDFGLLNFGIAGVSATRLLRLRNHSATSRARWSLGEEGGSKARPFLRADGSEPPESPVDHSGTAVAEAEEGDEQEIEGGVLSFTPSRGVLAPLETATVHVTFRPHRSGALRSAVSLHVLHSPLATPSYIGARGMVQAPALSLCPCVIEMDTRSIEQINDEEEAAKAAKIEEERRRQEEEAQRARDEAAAAEAAAILAAKEAAWAAERLAAEKAAEERRVAEAEAMANSGKGRKKMSASALAKQNREKEKEKAAAAAATVAAAAEAAAAAAAAAEQAEADAAAAVEAAAALSRPATAASRTEDEGAESPSSPSSPHSSSPSPHQNSNPNPAVQRVDSILCVRVPRTFEVELSNLSNLPAMFRWSMVGQGSGAAVQEQEQGQGQGQEKDALQLHLPGGGSGSRQRPPYLVRFEPSHGLISGRSSLKVSLTLTAFVSGPMHLLLACDLDGGGGGGAGAGASGSGGGGGQMRPLALEIKAWVRDVTVSYHVLRPEQLEQMEDQLVHTGVGLGAGGTGASPSSFGRTMSQASFGGTMTMHSSGSDASLGAMSHRSGGSSVMSQTSRGPGRRRRHHPLQPRHADWSSAEGLALLAARNQVLDQWIPAAQVHSKITRAAGEEEEEEGGGGQAEKSSDPDAPSPTLEEDEAEEAEQSAAAGGVDGTSAPSAIVPTASAMPVLDFGPAVPPGSKVSLVLLVRNHTEIPARFSARLTRLGAATSATEQEVQGSTGSAPVAAQLLKRKAAGASSAAGSALAAAKKLSSASADTAGHVSQSQLHSQRSVASMASMGSSMGSTWGGGSTRSLRSTAAPGADGKKPKKQPKPMRMLSGMARAEPLLSFQSPGGQVATAAALERTETRRLIPSGQGVAFTVSERSGTLAAFATAALVVTAHTDAVGVFQTELVVRTRGLGAVRVAVRVGVSGLALAVAPSTPGVLFPSSSAAARNKIETVQTRTALPVHSAEPQVDGPPAAGAGSLLSENEFLRSSDSAPVAALVAHGFDAYPKLFFPPLLASHSSSSSPLPSLSSPGSRSGSPTASTWGGRGGAAQGPSCSRTVHLENSGPVAIKVVWKQYDLRRIAHDRLVDVVISPGARVRRLGSDGDGAAEGAEQEQLVAVDVRRHTYADSNSDPIGASPSFSSPSAIFPFVLSSPEVVVPPRGSASFTVRYEPALVARDSDNDGDGSDPGPRHDLSFLEGVLYVPEDGSDDTDASETRTPTPPAAAGPASAPVSARSRALGKVLDDIDAFEGRTGVAMDGACSDSDEEGLATTTTQQRSLSRSNARSASSISSGAAAVAAYFAPPKPVRWTAAPESLSRHLFRLVLSARTVVPALHVDKKKGRLRFVAQPPSSAQAAAAAALESAASASADLAATMVRPSTASTQNGSIAGGGGGALSIHAHLPSVSAKSPTSSSQAQRAPSRTSMVKMLPLHNRTETALSFSVRVSPSDLFALQQPADAHKDKGKAPRARGGSGALASLPSPSHMGWKTTSAASGSDPTFNLAPGESLVLPVRFTAPDPSSSSLSSSSPRRDTNANRARSPSPSAHASWPLVPRCTVRGQVSLHFSNGSVQVVPLEGELLRPLLAVQPTAHDFGATQVRSLAGAFGGSEPDEAARTGRSGGVSKRHQQRLASQQLTLLLSNASLVDAVWRMEHEARPTRPVLPRGSLRSMHAPTLAALASPEFDSDAASIDDPRCFVFSRTGGVVPAGAGSLAPAAALLPTGVATPLTLSAQAHASDAGRNRTGAAALLGSQRPEVVQRVPVTIDVSFRPATKARYCSRFRFTCVHGADSGRSLLLELRGDGTYQETEE